MRRLVTLLLMGVVGCATITALPQNRKDAFEYIRSGHQYRYHFNDCTDMAQQYRDYLHYRHGVPLDKINVCTGTHKDFPDFAHAWLEVLGKKGWRVFDPAPRGGWNHQYRPGDYYSQFHFTRSWGGAIIFQPPPHAGYKRRGDRLMEGEWKRGSKKNPGKWYMEDV